MKEPNGTWTYVFSVPKDGKRAQVRRRGFRTKREAQDALSAALAGLGLGDRRVTVAPSAQPLADYLTGWLTAVSPDLKPTTGAGYASVVKAWIVPHLGSVPLRDITPGRVTALYATLRAAGSRSGGPLGDRSIQLAHVVLRSALAHAVEAGLLAVNPCDQIPRRTRPKSARRTEMVVWDAEQAGRFLVATRPSRWHALWALALDCGARRGELAGLRWADVDLDGGMVQIKRNRVVVSGRHVSTGTPKSDHGRTVHLAPSTVGILRRWRVQQLAEKVKWGPEAAGDYAHLFTVEDGTPPHPDRLSWELEKALREVDVPVLRFHDLRHTSATVDLLAGVHPKVVAEKLGHSSISMTLDIYSAFLPSMGEDAALRREAVLYGSAAG